MPHLLLLLTTLGIINCAAQKVFLNEIRANDASTDDAEFIELIGPAGADISGWSVSHINGSGGSVIFSFIFPANTLFPDDGITDSGGNPIGFLVLKNSAHTVSSSDFDWGPVGLQNGPDGILLEDADGNRIQALTYNGLGDLTGGIPPWRNIGSDANDDRSLSAPDDVTELSALAWSLEVATPGELNSNQITGDISLPVQLSAFNAIAGDNQVILRWQTEAEVNNLGFIIERAMATDSVFSELANYLSCEELNGQGNSSTTTKYSYKDITVFNGHKYLYRLSDVDVNGNVTVHKTIAVIPRASKIELREVNEGGLPLHYELMQNYPNPFNPNTRIRFSLPKSDEIRLSIYNITGAKIITLYNGFLHAGFYELEWTGLNDFGKDVVPGIYFYTLNSRNFYATRRMVYLK